MGRIYMIVLALCSVILSVSVVEGNIDVTPKGVDKWYKELRHKKEKVTKLRFFLHEKGSSGDNQTAYLVAQSNISFTSPSNFGLVSMIDDILRKGAAPDSQIVGRTQGLMGSSSMEETSLIMALTFVFTTGKYNGSSISFLGRNPLANNYREIPIVGGSGYFRLARGIITTRTITLDIPTLRVIAEYKLLVFHY
ncbi:Dirigent protein [Heracleum sosnowskyi]|uniref:Dirigent protein n=1 Tax=Heracleum sosnowskyi TaxID=360622 RepID=A0AAD8MSA9_9APIA|nr:Dirigent protein [Heracleum sosnowskyi]